MRVKDKAIVLMHHKAEAYDRMVAWLEDFKTQIHMKSNNHLLSGIAHQIEKVIAGPVESDEQVQDA